ncbi:MAG: dTMP kinase [Bacilli bacterium]
MKKSKFIVFEGGEGSGKTTIANKMKDQLEKEGYEVLYSREPGGVKIAEEIRNIILDKNNTELEKRTEALLFAAARRQHLVEKVIPALNEGKIVICDRFIHSSLVYQGIARGIGIEEVYDVNLFAIDDCLPDIVICLDIDPEIGLQRASERPEENNRIDNEKIEFHKTVNAGYLKIAEYDKSIVVVDASKPKEEVFSEVYKIIKENIQQKKL